MKVLITGVCGFVGSVLATSLPGEIEGLDITGLDNLSRPGSELNRAQFRQGPVRLMHGDVRNASDLEGLPKVDWVIDAAANPSVLAGLSAQTSSRQLMEHNLLGTINLLEFCKRQGSGLVLLSTSRVYSLARLAGLPMLDQGEALKPDFQMVKEPGLSDNGVNESFSTQPPVSLYGSAKLASELVSLEYGSAFGLPVYINRCGVLAGAGQFGRADQGIFSFWIHSYYEKRPLKYIGFGGQGHQVRDCLHPRDLASLIAMQLRHPERAGQVLNVSGGADHSMSLAQLTRWCAEHFGGHTVTAESASRPFDIPWMVLDSSKAQSAWGWQPMLSLKNILDEITEHARQNPRWLELTAGG